MTGFVPQDDIVHPRLTVEENLLFSARFRLPKHTSRREHLELVDRAISLLGLTEVRNSLVGNEESRGVSGGQRKRVNIGLELVADPCVMFLDEPTSGLDSSSCRHVITVLSRVAHMGVTCAAVVHQPSNRIMSKFDDILLLGSVRFRFLILFSLFLERRDGLLRTTVNAESVLSLIGISFSNE